MPIFDTLSAYDAGTIVPAVLDAIEQPVRRMATGWSLLDECLNDGADQQGFVVPSFAILAAEPKAGKSRWAQFVAERHAEKGGIVYYLDMENGRRRFWRRSLSAKSGLGAGKITALLTKADQEKRAAAREWAKGLAGRFYYDDTHKIRTPDELLARIVELRAKVGDHARLLIIVDSLQKLPMADMTNRRASVDNWLRKIEEIRDVADAVILAISELRRPSQEHGTTKSYKSERGYGAARSSHLKESGDAEYTADIVLLLSSACPGDPANWKDPNAVWRGDTYNLTIDCNRDGVTGKVASYCSIFPYHGMQEKPFYMRNNEE